MSRRGPQSCVVHSGKSLVARCVYMRNLSWIIVQRHHSPTSELPGLKQHWVFHLHKEYVFIINWSFLSSFLTPQESDKRLLRSCGEFNRLREEIESIITKRHSKRQSWLTCLKLLWSENSSHTIYTCYDVYMYLFYIR